MVYKWNDDAENPCFSQCAKEGTCSNKKGFTFIYSNQCPFMEEYVGIMSEAVTKRKQPFKIVKIISYKEAQQIASPFGTLGIYYNGQIQNHEIMPEKKFNKFINEILEKS